MVTESLKCLLDSLKTLFDSQEINPKLIYPILQSEGYLSRNEIRMIELKETETMQINVNNEQEICDMLKSKTADVFVVLQKAAVKNKWNKITEYIEDQLKELNFDSLLIDKSSVLYAIKDVDERSEDVEKIKKNLKIYLEQDIQILSNYWEKLGVSRLDRWENFYSSNLIFTDEFGNVLPKVSSFDGLFEDGKLYKRIVVFGPAGYGKSTFAHELVRQWINGCEWTKQFSLVFLFRLGEILPSNSTCSTANPLSFKCLLRKCLSETNLQLFETCFEETLYSEVLFVFDGFDELQRELVDDDIYDLIIGQSKYKPYVLITTRQDGLKILKDAKSKGNCVNVYLELRGFTENGILDQLKKFNAVELAEKVDADILKIPLFNTIFGILQAEEKICLTTNQFSLIEKLVKYLMARYQHTNQNLSDNDELDILLILGQAAQAQFSMMRAYSPFKSRFRVMEPAVTSSSLLNNVKSFFTKVACGRISMPNFSTAQNNRFLTIAKSAGLILTSSNNTAIYFPHQLFAEYFAAIFWSKNHDLKIKCLPDRICYVVHFLDNNCCDPTSWFSAFLSCLNSTYKDQMWREYANCLMFANVPLIIDYKNLPCIQPKCKVVSFLYLSDKMARSAMEILTFSRITKLRYLKFESGSPFSNLSNVVELTLWNCTLNLAAQEFFKFCRSLVSLKLSRCTFTTCQNYGTTNSSLSKFQIAKNLQSFFIVQPTEGQISNFVSETLGMFKNNLKSLWFYEVNEFEWIRSLENRTFLNAQISFGKFSSCIKNLDEGYNILANDFILSNEKHFTLDIKFG